MEKITVLDIITTAQGGKRLLEYRVSAINGDSGKQKKLFTSLYFSQSLLCDPCTACVSFLPSSKSHL
jgi:hypothetical protein